MTWYKLIEANTPLPTISDVAAVELGKVRFAEAAKAESDAAGRVAAFAREPRGRELLDGIFCHSPYLTSLILRDLAFFADLVENGADQAIDVALAEIPEAGAEPDSAADLMRRLRRARQRSALVTAVADIGGLWSLGQVTGALAELAERATDASVRFLLRERAAAGHLVLRNTADPGRDSGFVVLGMGKFGARELNYSSDIDLIVLFEPEAIDYRGSATVHDLCIDMTKRMVRLLQERTADGYVFRTDLRLRPDAGATPIAIAMAGAEHYYESVGQNWERAAFIKARSIAGDRAAGDLFLKRIAPFVWRKHLDFSAIADIHSIKRQIHAHHGHGTISTLGHNVKLGRGGIREIEFFVQTQQLVAGGRNPRLRTRDTVSGLVALAGAGRLDTTVARELTEAYEFLRKIEHRLQMVNDEQTHTLPDDASGIARIAAFLGYSSSNAFTADLEQTLTTVVGHYGHLFEHAPPLGNQSGSLVFTGTADDPDTVATLKRLGFHEPSTVAARIRSWHHGRFNATRTVRARELLTALMPRLLEALAATANPDVALTRFDEFLSKLPAGVQLFSLFYENPQLLTLVAEIMGTAPRLADELARTPSLLDGVLSAEFFSPMPGKPELRHELGDALARANHYEDVLDIARRFANERRFRADVHLLRGATDVRATAAHLSDIAEVVLEALTAEVEKHFVDRHGSVAGGAFAVIGFGKLGAREMTPVSDLDLVFVYAAPESGAASDGSTPLAASQYFIRFSQRLITAVTTLTSEGRLYTIDMRLRPAGNKGPIASHVGAFARYMRTEAWTWEHMALTRARVIDAPPALRRTIEAVVTEVLVSPRDIDRLRVDIRDMRRRVGAQHPPLGDWDVKYTSGGLLDAEFLCQFLQLAHAHRFASLLGGRTDEAFRKFGDVGLLPRAEATDLTEATALLHGIQSILRLTASEALDEGTAPEGLKRALGAATGHLEFSALTRAFATAKTTIRSAFERHLEEPATAAGRGRKGVDGIQVASKSTGENIDA